MECFETCPHHKGNEWTKELDLGPSSEFELHVFYYRWASGASAQWFLKWHPEVLDFKVNLMTLTFSFLKISPFLDNYLPACFHSLSPPWANGTAQLPRTMWQWPYARLLLVAYSPPLLHPNTHTPHGLYQNLADVLKSPSFPAPRFEMIGEGGGVRTSILLFLLSPFFPPSFTKG